MKNVQMSASARESARTRRRRRIATQAKYRRFYGRSTAARTQGTRA